MLPELETAGRVVRASTSAGIFTHRYRRTMPGSDGLHVYVLLTDGADIERFLRTLHERCWLHGLGWLMVGAAGQLLDRSIVDRMVGAPERLVFEGAPILEPPLAQDQASRAPVVIDGRPLDTLAACPPLTIVEQAKLRELQGDGSASPRTRCRQGARTRSSPSRPKRIVSAPADAGAATPRRSSANATASCCPMWCCRSMTANWPAAPSATCWPTLSASSARRSPIRSRASNTDGARPRSCGGRTARCGSTSSPTAARPMS